MVLSQRLGKVEKLNKLIFIVSAISEELSAGRIAGGSFLGGGGIFQDSSLECNSPGVIMPVVNSPGAILQEAICWGEAIH